MVISLPGCNSKNTAPHSVTILLYPAVLGGNISTGGMQNNITDPKSLTMTTLHLIRIVLMLSWHD